MSTKYAVPFSSPVIVHEVVDVEQAPTGDPPELPKYASAL
jgi:hypothetical protein